MSNNESQYPVTANEPKMHPLLKNSFVFVPSAGMRVAPELLILELMREVFFVKHHGALTTSTRELNPDELENQLPVFTKQERAVLHAMRGRRKKSRQATAQTFFAPAYPQLAVRGWLGKNRERVVHNFLLAGPLAQYLWWRGDTQGAKDKQHEVIEKITKSLLGHRSFPCVGSPPPDIFAAILNLSEAESEPYARTAKDQLLEKTSDTSHVFRLEDTLASRITLDLLAICELERSLPRMQWLQLLMSFLRFALPMWLLAQMQLTQFLHGWTIQAADGSTLLPPETIDLSIKSRCRGLLHPTLMPTRQLFSHIEDYMKSRVELNILLHSLQKIGCSQLTGKQRLSLENTSNEKLNIGDFLLLVKDQTPHLKAWPHYTRLSGLNDIRTFLIREGEQFGAWRDPLMRGQGKNINEFFRVLYQVDSGDEAGGYLFTPEGRGANRGFRVFPGLLLLKTMTYLASQTKTAGRSGRGGVLVLQDVEDHFGYYGIDFAVNADARPLLMRELQALGLLNGSPDAGSSVAVSCPYLKGKNAY